MSAQKHSVLAIVAHPDDIEFVMAGTLLLFKQAGAEIHMLNVANGSCGTATYGRDEIVKMRWAEAQAAANVAGATMHPPLVDDLAIFYEPSMLARIGAIVRQVKPTVVLTHSPSDYMEDHMNACRLAVTAAFSRGMKNFVTEPRLPPWGGDTAVYHALPHGLRDPLRRRVVPGQYVNIESVLATKREMLAQHKSQKEWLDVSQGMDAYLNAMEEMSAKVGRMSGRFKFAEGFRRHLHLGFGPEDYDPLQSVLGDLCWSDPKYEESLG